MSNNDALRDEFNAFLLEQHERHKHQHNHFHVARNEWARRTQATQYEALAASKPEPQAQAAEPEVVAVAGDNGNIGATKYGCATLYVGDPLITMQSHRDAMTKVHDACVSYKVMYERMCDAAQDLANYSKEKNAALDACVEALRIALTQNGHDMLMTGEEQRIAIAAITKAQEARK